MMDGMSELVEKLQAAYGAEPFTTKQVLDHPDIPLALFGPIVEYRATQSEASAVISAGKIMQNDPGVERVGRVRGGSLWRVKA